MKRLVLSTIISGLALTIQSCAVYAPPPYGYSYYGPSYGYRPFGYYGFRRRPYVWGGGYGWYGHWR